MIGMHVGFGFELMSVSEDIADAWIGYFLGYLVLEYVAIDLLHYVLMMALD